MMRIYRAVICVLFVVITALFGWTVYSSNKGKDTTVPEITVPDGVLQVQLDATDEDFLAGVTATDKKDGDITDKVIVESVSKFTDAEQGLCTVNYAVCDGDKHVASASRKVQYMGYTHPRFVLSRSLCFSDSQIIDFSSTIGAIDCIEGDISDNIIITSDNFEDRKAGHYTVNVSVTNSMGDTISAELPVTVEEAESNAPTIELKEYLVYVDKKGTLNPGDYLKSAKDAMEESLKSSVTYTSNLDTKKTGVYSVDYYVTDSLGRTGHTILTVIVGD